MKPKLKICGLKHPDNILEVAQLLPDYMGFIFYEKSPRYCNAILPEVPKSIQKVGVFVQASISEIITKVKNYNLDLVQLHGGESVSFCQELLATLHLEKLEKVQLIKVFSVENELDTKHIATFETCCDFFLFDTKSPSYGGTGNAFDWSILQHYSSAKPYFLSGGISLENLTVIKQLNHSPYALDVNSKFEDVPGVKNSTQLKKLQDEL